MSLSTDNLVTVSHLKKSYKNAVALQDLSFHLNKGEMVGLLGSNGAGKTTAIHVLLGLVTPTSGEVSVLGLTPHKHRHELSQKINFSSAYVQLPSNLKVWENLKIFAKLYGVKNYQAKIDELFTLFEVNELRDRLCGALSSGEKTRVNLCKAFLNDPLLLLLDEPTASLDPEMADKVRKVLKKIQNERGTGILYTSHNMKEVEEICDRILFLKEGRLVASGTKESVLKEFQSKDLEEFFIKMVRMDQ